MGGGGDKDYERGKLDTQQQQTDKDYSNFQTGINSGKDTRDAQYNDTFGQTKDNLTGFTGATGGISAEDEARLRGLYSAPAASSSSGGGSGGGGGAQGGSALNGVDIPKTSAYSGIGDLGPSASANVNIPTTSAFSGLGDSAFNGVNVNTTNYAAGVKDADLAKSKEGYTNFADTGGVTGQDRSDILRQSLINQETTGGYTPEDISRIRAKAAGSAASTYGALKDSLDRSRAINGNTTGLSGTNFKLAKSAAEQQASDRNNAEIGLADKVRANKYQAGLDLSSAATGLTGLRTGNQLAGLGGLEKTQLDDSNFQLDRAKGADTANANINSAQLQKAAGVDSYGIAKATGLDQATATQVSQQLQKASQMDDQSKAAINAQIAKATGLDQYTIQSIQAQIDKANGLDNYAIAQQQLGQSASNASAARTAADREDQANNERWIISQQQAGKQYGTSGLGDLTSLAGSQRLGYDQLAGSTIGQRANVGQGNIGLGLQNDQQNQSKLGQYITSGLGSVAGLAGGLLTGGIVKKKPVLTTNPDGGG